LNENLGKSPFSLRATTMADAQRWVEVLLAVRNSQSNGFNAEASPSGPPLPQFSSTRSVSSVSTSATDNQQKGLTRSNTSTENDGGSSADTKA
jgi:hypothetical protein